ncbi:2-amino-3-carboxymuconate-6-semialdehyde decarboxylase [Colletotrichum camelliae]|nr:2-amino-3-carboxymuconate-6-semialdehyde decarboxylase [Colletotrichum camelliae]
MANPIPPLVTLEEHFVSQDNFSALSKLYAEQLKHLPEVANQLLDVSQLRLTSMDNNGISFQVISHAPGLGPKPARYSSSANDELARAVKAHPDRFAAFAVLPMAEPQAAAAELRRCVGMGFVGALVDAHVDGVHYDDRRFWPVFEAAADLDVPIYLHPTYPSPTQSSAYDGQYGQGAARSLGSSGFGWHQETGLAVLKLFAAGLFDELPSLKVLIGHFGEMLPFMIERIAKLSVRWGNRSRPWRQVWRENIWITTSGVWELAPMACILRNTSLSHILYSVDYPFEKNETGLCWMRELQESGLVTPDQLEMIAHRNAEQLLKLRIPTREFMVRVLDALVDAGFDVTVLVRRQSLPSAYPPGVRVCEIDYSSLDSLRGALRGIDAVISTVGKRNGLESQFRLIDAAVMEGVNRFIPSEFGADLQHKEVRTFPTYQTKIEIEEYLEKKARETNLTYTFIYCSALFDEGLDLGAFADFKARKVNFFDGGATTFNATRSITVAHAVVAALNKLEATKNKAVRIRDVSMTPKELLKVIQGLDRNGDWTSVAIDTGKLVQGAQAELASGKFSPKAFAAFAMRATFAPGLAGQYGDDNDHLGIKDIAKEDLENALRSRLLV